MGRNTQLFVSTFMDVICDQFSLAQGKIVSRICRQGVAVIVLGVWLMYTGMEIGVRIIRKEGKGER